ncbi:MAG TPA: HAMP domain-containing sensor histidine kinase [Anaerolineales bacterium]|nr:HAMP domain-containing sensor histidine kinase [Anaerolineales bacterium]
MNRNSIRWRLPASYGIIALLAALSLGSVMLLVLRSYYARQEQDYLFGNALALQPIIERALQSNLPQELLQDQIDSLAFLSQTRVRVLDTSGRIKADSGVPHLNQIVAVMGETKREIPYSGPAVLPEDKIPFVIYSNKSQTVPQMMPFEKELSSSGPAPQTDMILSVSASPYGYGFVPAAHSDPTRRSPYVAEILLIASDGRKLGVLEFSNGPSYGADVIDSVTLAWLIASVFAIAIAALTGWFMSKRVTRPVLALENATRQMEQGDLSVRVVLPNERQQEFVSLANSFNGMAEQVEQTVSTLRAFVADAAHELHTPLTALQANIELARNETLAPGASAGENASARTRYLARAQEQGQRLEALVKSLLDLSRIEAAVSKSGLAPVDMLQLVREVGEQYASRAEQTERSFTMDAPEEPVQVQGNEAQLRQVVSNLLENALKFTPASGLISLNLERSENELQLAVSDSGIGIPPDDLPQLFERFHRARNAAEYSGNGLGLAIVKAIVQSHGGSVTAHSAGPGEGSRFVLNLPLD